MRRRGRSIPKAVTIEAWLFVVAVAGTAWLYQAGFIDALVALSVDMGPHFGALIAGAMFSTFVTTPFAVAGFLGIGSGLDVPIWQIAAVGALGATIVDLLLVKGIRSPLAILIVNAITKSDIGNFQKRLQKWPAFRWTTALIGGLLVGVPLPTDELGVVFFGASGLRAYQMAPLIFVADFVGVYAMVSAGRFFEGF